MLGITNQGGDPSSILRRPRGTGHEEVPADDEGSQDPGPHHGWWIEPPIFDGKFPAIYGQTGVGLLYWSIININQVG